jgi:PKD repeat protein
MKKIYLILICLVSASLTKAQTTIDAADIPVAGQVFAVAYDTLPGITITPADNSAGTWDYSALLMNTTDTFSYFNPALTPQGSAFSSSDMASYDRFSGVYSYYKHRAAGLFIQGISIDASGFGFGVLNLTATPEEKFIADPTTLGTSYNVDTRYEVTFDKNSSDPDTTFTHFVKRTVIADAFGSMTTSFGTYNTVRVHSFETTADTAFITFFGFPVGNIEVLPRDTINRYTFYIDTTGHPIVTIVANAADSIRYVEFLTGDQFLPNALFDVSNQYPSTVETINFINNSVGSTSWLWDFGDGTATSTLFAPSHVYTAPGLYDVKLIAYNANGSDTLTEIEYINVSFPAGLKENELNSGISIYPNPATSQVSISFEENAAGIIFQVFDVTGKIVKTATSNGGTFTMNTSDLSRGLYMFKAIKSDGKLVKAGKFSIVR